MKKIFILTVATLLLVGCGGGGSSSDSGSTGPSGTVELTINQVETVYPGNKVVKDSEDALVQINHTDGAETSTIVLLQGSATIIRNP